MERNLPSGIILLAVGLALGAWGGSEALDGYRTHSWPEASGVIEESRGTDPHKPAIDHFHLSYRYEAGGVSRVGHRVAVGGDGLEGTRLARVFPVGREVRIYYDPANPDLAVLYRGVDFTPKLKLGVALALILLAVSLFRGRRSVPEARAPRAT